MLKLQQIQTGMASKSRIFFLNLGGMRNSIFSNQIMKTSDFEKILKNLEFSKNQFHSLMSLHVNNLFPYSIHEEYKLKISKISLKFPSELAGGVEEYLTDIKEKLSNIVTTKFATWTYDAMLKEMQLLRREIARLNNYSIDSSQETSKFNLINKEYSSRELRAKYLEKKKKLESILSSQLTIYDKMLSLNRFQLNEAEEDLAENTQKVINSLQIVMKSVNPYKSKVDLQIGDILIYIGEYSFSLIITDVIGNFQYYPILYVKDIGISIHPSKLNSISESDRSIATYVSVIDDFNKQMIDAAAEFFEE